jgi:hypothetical protein
MGQPSAPTLNPSVQKSVHITAGQLVVGGVGGSQATWVHASPGFTQTPQLALQHSVPAGHFALPQVAPEVSESCLVEPMVWSPAQPASASTRSET